MPAGSRMVCPHGLHLGVRGVALRVKQYLADRDDSQPPQLVLPMQMLDALPWPPSLGSAHVQAPRQRRASKPPHTMSALRPTILLALVAPLSNKSHCLLCLCIAVLQRLTDTPGFAQHNVVKKKAHDALLAAAKALREEPYRMGAAAGALEAWLLGTMIQAPPLNVSLVTSGEKIKLAGPQPLGDIESTIAILDLEPVVKSVRCVPRRGANAAVRPRCNVSAQARFVYPMAVGFSRDMSWGDALSVATAAWRDGGHALPPEPLVEEAEDDGEAAPRPGDESDDLFGPDDS